MHFVKYRDQTSDREERLSRRGDRGLRPCSGQTCQLGADLMEGMEETEEIKKIFYLEENPSGPVSDH